MLISTCSLQALYKQQYIFMQTYIAEQCMHCVNTQHSFTCTVCECYGLLYIKHVYIFCFVENRPTEGSFDQ